MTEEALLEGSGTGREKKIEFEEKKLNERR
jgi:hypothetical protein